MFRWLTGNGKDAERCAMPEIGAHSNIDELLERELVVLFKHSHACPVSWAAHSQMTRFAAHNPSIPIYLIPVIKERAFSREVARRIEVDHESPQVIVLRRGIVTGVASHGEITESELTRMLQPG
jgi:bacillithiol system protein YtxJ